MVARYLKWYEEDLQLNKSAKQTIQLRCETKPSQILGHALYGMEGQAKQCMGKRIKISIINYDNALL